jgi:hypothetical protein
MRPFTFAICGLLAAAAFPVAAHAATKPFLAGPAVPAAVLVHRIDLDCAIASSETELAQPTQIAGTDVPSVRARAVLFEVWRRAGHYVWVQSRSYDAQAGEQVTQYCFRNDGTLARVRQATNVPAHDAASVREAYVDEDGSLIAARAGFEEQGEFYTVTVQELPFQAVLH